MSINRLKALLAENFEAGEQMATEAARFASLAARHETGTAPRAVSAFNLFQTPADVARAMVQRVAHKLGSGARVLEPSAGLGRIYSALRSECMDSRAVLVEQSPECFRELYHLTDEDDRATLKQADFLEVCADDLGGGFDAVVMNPPFKQGRDIKHILHAFDMLKPGGVLVALCYNGKRQNAKLNKPLTDSWDVLPKGTFKSEGTAASAAMLTMSKYK